jgi:hypothetical protein
MPLDTRWKNPQGSDPKQLHLWAQDLIKELRKGDYLGGAIPGTGLPNSELADMAAWTIKMRNAGTAGDPQDVTIGSLAEAEDPAEPGGWLLGENPPGGSELRKFSTGQVGGLHLLDSGIVTNSATLDIVLTSFAAYRGLLLLLSGFIPATEPSALQMQVSTNGGSSYDSGASDYRYASWGWSNGGQGPNQSSAAAQIQFGPAEVGSGANEGLDAEFLLLNQTSTAIKPKISGRVWYYTSSDQAAHQITSGQRNAAQDTDAIRFRFSGGNIASGNWALYGYA